MLKRICGILRWLAPIFPVLCASAALAANVDLVAPWGDFALVDPTVAPPSAANGDIPTAPAAPRTYGATGPGARWQIAQWNIPGPRLSPFQARGEGGYEARTAEATVRVGQGPSGRQVSLSQRGASLPCLGFNRPRESDLFIQPIKDEQGLGRTGLTPAAAHMPLTRMRRLMVIATVSASGGPSPVQKGCQASRGSGMIAVSLTNRASGQTFFYQLVINQVCSPENRGGYPDCMPWLHKPSYWSRKNPFGVADTLPLLGRPYLRDGETRDLRLDILPRLKRFIEQGPPGIDTNLGDWQFGGAYIGQHIFGDVDLTTTWAGYRLVAVTD
ncbi:MAG TPA: hypothetical protein VGS12_00815 [Caulobacteraceae bacterium]|nr:hypothetical protein [Caulobacteraceae bacterium]